jgi:hypothetical protein
MKDDGRKAPRLRGITGGRNRTLRRPHDLCADWPVLIVSTPEDEEYAAEVAQLLADREREQRRRALVVVSDSR